MGLLQAMTTVTNKVISEVYAVPPTTYNFQVMYMPMNTGTFHNDFYYEYIGSTLVVVYFAILKLSDSVISTIGDVKYEDLIQSTLKRAGMRKSVELYIDGGLTILASLILFPLVTYLTVNNVIYGSLSYGFMIQAVLVFVLNYITEKHMIKFALPESSAEKVNKALEIISIIFVIQSAFLRKTANWYVYATSIFPYNFLSWYIRFGMRAYYREVELKSDMTLFQDVSLETVMEIGLYALLVKTLIIIYCWPVQISGSIHNKNGYFYMCKLSWWRTCCCSSERRIEEIDDDDEDRESSVLSLDDAKKYLLPSEIEMMSKQGPDYEKLYKNKTNLRRLQLESIVKKFEGKDKPTIDDLSLTCFKGEIFVLIGENGAGKTTLLEGIAGNQDLEGNIKAFDIDVKNGIRFLDDLITY